MHPPDLKILRGQLEATTDRSLLKEPLQSTAILAAEGDGEALELLLAAVDAHSLAMPAIARQLFDPHDQQDVQQDVLVAVARSIGGFRGDAHFLTWLHTVATNCSLGFVAKQRATVPFDEHDQPASWTAKFTSIATTNMAVRQAIGDLPELYQQAVTLRDVHHLSYADTAERLGLNLNTTRARIARGRALVAAQLGDSVSGMDR